MAAFSLRKLFYSLPPGLRFWVRRLYYLPVDSWEGLTGRRDPLTPPKGLIFTGSGDFVEQGQKLFRRFVEEGQLQPHHQVLDIGSGIGRAAVPLTQYLNEEGGYEGFDVVELGVNWCRKHISARFPNFQFTYIPLNNDLYRSDGEDAAGFQFPYEANSFDLIISNSVFTHMLPEEVDNYLGEISRVMKPAGRCYASFFVLNEESKQGMERQPDFQFTYDHGHYRLLDEKVQAANVAFEEKYLLGKLFPRHGLRPKVTRYGYWSGRYREPGQDFQDYFILTKEGR